MLAPVESIANQLAVRAVSASFDIEPAQAEEWRQSVGSLPIKGVSVIYFVKLAKQITLTPLILLWSLSRVKIRDRSLNSATSSMPIL